MLIYADGSALARLLGGDPESAAWRELVQERGFDLLTSPLGLTELRRIADPLGHDARTLAMDIAQRFRVVRFSDQAIVAATRAAVAAPPFTSFHIGVATTVEGVDSIATYDTLLARMTEIYGLTVVSPGRPFGWWRG
jgi:hypothetical protein